MASTTPVSPTTLWTGPRRGPIFELRDFFHGTRERCDFHVEHYSHQHVINDRWILVDVGLHYEPHVIEVALGNGFIAFQLLFHMGITPMAHVWEGLYMKLSNPPDPIEDMDLASLAQFLGVILTQGQDKDEILTHFVQLECDAHGYRVPQVLPFDHEFRALDLKPPQCSEAACHTCRPPPVKCGCMACYECKCLCPGCSAKRKAWQSSLRREQACAVCKEQGKDWDENCPNCNEPSPPSTPTESPPSTPGAHLKTADTEKEYLEFMEEREREFWESRRVERELWLTSRRAKRQE